jgi:hypothetical protein
MSTKDLIKLAEKLDTKYASGPDEMILEEVKSIVHPMISELQKALNLLDKLPQDKVKHIESIVGFDNLKTTNKTLWKIFHAANNLLLGSPVPE